MHANKGLPSKVTHISSNMQAILGGNVCGKQTYLVIVIDVNNKLRFVFHMQIINFKYLGGNVST